MSLPIISAQQRMAERKGVKLLMLGKSGIGKTTRLRDLEAQLGEAHDRELRLTELAASATRLLEHREAATVPPPRGWLRRLLGF